MNWTRNLPGLIGLLVAVLVWQFALIPSASQTPTAMIRVFDVGQGDAILLTTPNRRHILIDGGPDATVLTRLGEFLRFNEHLLDLVIVSHNHADHITGLNRVLERYDVKKVWVSGTVYTTNEYKKLRDTLNAKSVTTQEVTADTIVEIDGVTLDVVFPIAKLAGQSPRDPHDATLVVRACYTTCALLTGDIDERHEAAMISSGQPLDVEILKVPHHGSKTGTSPQLLAATSPSHAIISVGKNNRFGHPTPEVIRRVEAAGARLFRTDRDKTVVCVLTAPPDCRPSI